MIYRFFYITFSFYYTFLYIVKAIKRKLIPEEDLIFQRRLDAIKAAIGSPGMNPIHRATLRKLLTDLRRL